MKNITIRKAAESDIPSLNGLLYQVHKIHSDARPDIFVPGAKKYTDSELRAVLADSSRPVFVAESDGAVLGYAFCILKREGGGSMQKRKYLYIDDLCVDGGARGLHIGSALYRAVKSFAKESDCCEITLNVWADNPKAVEFYRRIGMRVQKYVMEDIL